MAAKQQAAYSSVNERTLATYAEMIQQTTHSLDTCLVNFASLIDTSEDGVYRLLRLICDRYEFIINDMQRELKGKDPFDGTKLECLDFSEEFKREYPTRFQQTGGAQ